MKRKHVQGRRAARLAIAGLGAGLVGRAVLGRLREAELRGQVVLVTGGSRGLGLILAREFARQGCRLVICAREQEELNRARRDLERPERGGAEVLAVRCDVSNRDRVDDLVGQATRHFGRVDVLVNNAGIITVGPVQSMTHEDFEAAMAINFWGTVYPTLAVLPQMRERRSGRIVNITSFGGKVSLPHLLPYSCSKFAAVAFSQGLRSELARDGITVTTIAPSPLRTGSHLAAQFKGRREEEFTQFALAASLPFISMDAERAARQIIQATRRGEAERILSLAANVGARLYALFPGAMADLFGLVNRYVQPSPSGVEVGTSGGGRPLRGIELLPRVERGPFKAATTLGRSAAERFHQYGGARPTVGEDGSA